LHVFLAAKAAHRTLEGVERKSPTGRVEALHQSAIARPMKVM
jgi:hypothetical protein